MRRVVVGVAAYLMVLLSATLLLKAEDYSQYLEMLENSGDFRVRVRSALVLARAGGTSVIKALENALNDPHPAVRAAAAASLGKIGDANSAPALLRAQQDESPVVSRQATSSLEAIRTLGSHSPQTGAANSAAASSSPASPTLDMRSIDWKNVDHVIMLGQMQNQSNAGDSSLLESLRAELVRNLGEFKTILVLDNPQALDETARREIRRRGIKCLRVEGNVVRVEKIVQNGKVSSRCEISLLVLDDPGMVMVAIMNGSATGTGYVNVVTEKTNRELLIRTISGAVRSALRNFGQIINVSARPEAS